MDKIIKPVPGASVLLRADGVYTEAPLYVGPFDCGFVRNPRGDGYLRLLYAGGTSCAGVDYSGVWGAVLAKGLGNETVVTQEKPRPQADYPQPDYSQADWSKVASDDDEALRKHFDGIIEIAHSYAAPGRLLGGPSGALCALRRIEDRTCAARTLCDRMIGSYQKGD
jgi:hypothetical protein